MAALKRRSALLSMAAVPLLAGRAFGAAAPEPTQRFAMAWHEGGPAAGDGGHRVGILEADWDSAQLHLRASLPVPARAHGLLALSDGGFVAVANRPGRWLLRADAQGRPVQLRDISAETPARTFNGHALASADGAWLYTVETDPRDDSGWVSVRDARSLARVAQFESGDPDPHQLLPAGDGSLWVANGGIPRDVQGRKINLERMSPSLARLDPASGRLLGRWRLPDPRLSIRHLALSGELLGLALQAEHDGAPLRTAAPALAVWDGRGLTIPSLDPAAGGYAGDIAAGPGGGFVISAQKQGRNLWWQPGAPNDLTPVAQINDPCALAAWPDAAGVTMAAARGLARWHASLPPRMLAWPVPLAPDNHAVLLADTT